MPAGPRLSSGQGPPAPAVDYQAAPAPYWGLCEKHAREDDPEYFEYQKWLIGEDDEGGRDD